MTGSMVWTEEEVRYLQAVLSWHPGELDEIHDLKDPSRSVPQSAKNTVATAELKLLVLGAQGCGKTTLLNRFGEGAFAPEPQQEHIPPVSLSGLACCHSLRLPTHDGDRVYSVDVLELPADKNDDYLRQAVSATDAAIVVYDVTSRSSFEVAETLLRTRLPAALSPKKISGAHEKPDIINTDDTSQPLREYALLLLGNKTDLCQAGGGGNQYSSEPSSLSSSMTGRRRRHSHSDTTNNQSLKSTSASGAIETTAEDTTLPFDVNPIQASVGGGTLRPPKQRQKHQHKQQPFNPHLPSQKFPSIRRRMVSYTEAQRLADSSIGTSNTTSSSHHQQIEYPPPLPPPPYQGNNIATLGRRRCCGFVEASALEGYNVAEAFQVVGREILRMRNQRQGDRGGQEGKNTMGGEVTHNEEEEEEEEEEDMTKTTTPPGKKLKHWLQRVVSEGKGEK